jgi:hypothetical protein
VTVTYSSKTLNWTEPKERSSISGLVVYARVDGSFAVWDPINKILADSIIRKKSSVLLSREDVWNGKDDQIEGLIRDWVKWKERPDKYPEYNTFEKVLLKLAPEDVGPIEIGEPKRIPGQRKEVPTIKHPYGEVPIILESAGFKRVITLAYLIVWAWQEHKIQAKLANRKEERQMVILIDEVEAHLHPKWQRKILPALLGIAGDLHPELSLQLIVTTHSPLVLASSETIFLPNTDKLFHLDIDKKGRALFSKLSFELRGTIDSWLSSPAFGLEYPGSDERRIAIEKAVKLQESEKINKVNVEAITEELRRVLSSEDIFWIRWVLFAEKYGVKV